MKTLLAALCLLCSTMFLPAEDKAKDPVKLKLAILDALQAAPDEFFSGNNVWILMELGKGRKWQDVKDATAKEADLKAIESLPDSARREQARESVLRIADNAAVISLAEKLFSEAPPAAEPEPDLPHAEVQAGCDKAEALLDELLSAEDKALSNQRQYEKAIKRIDQLAGTGTGPPEPEGDNMPLQMRLDTAPSAEVDGKALIRLKLLAMGFSWEETKARLEKAPAEIVTGLGKLPLPSRRRVARDCAYNIRDRDTLLLLNPGGK